MTAICYYVCFTLSGREVAACKINSLHAIIDKCRHHRSIACLSKCAYVHW